MSNHAPGSLPLGGHPHGPPKPITMDEVMSRDESCWFDVSGSGFAKLASYNPTGAASYYIRGILDMRSDSPDVWQGHQSMAITFRCPESDVSRVRNGDTLVVDGKTYHVIDQRPDGNKNTILNLSLEAHVTAS